MSTKLEFNLRAIGAKIRGFLGGQQHDDEFDSEVQEHLDLLAERFVAQGMTREQAAAAARRQFGNTTLLQEDRRELQTLTSLESLWLDVRYAVRSLWKSRGFAAVSIATLALGIGAATAIFSVIDNVLVAPFPYPAAERIVFPRIHGAQQSEEAGRQGYTADEVLEIAETNHVFAGTTAAQDNLFLYKNGEGTEQLEGARVTPGTFEFFGLPALHGRLLEASDYDPGAPPVFVMRYQTWKERFNGDFTILNHSFLLDGTSRTLVGILPPRFGWYGVEIYVPEKLVRGAAAGFPNWFLAGRLKPGVSIEKAQADLTVIGKRLALGHPKDYPSQFTVLIKPIGDTVIGRFRQTLYTVLAAVFLLLLIACSNVANLMLARATTREKELALRAALGAKRGRIIRLLMFESMVAAIAGGAFGILIAWCGLNALVAAMPEYFIPAETVIELNAPVLVFTVGVSLLTALIFGLAPALQSSRRDVNDALRDSGKGVSTGFRGKWLRDAVVVGEIALSLTLLIGAGLLMRSFVALREINLGLRADHVFQAAVVLPEGRYKTIEQVTNFFRPLLARLKASPGVIDAAESSALPPFNYEQRKIEIVGKSHPEDWQALLQHASEEYFRTLQIEFKEGRPFSEEEVNNARPVAVVNQTFIRKYLANEDPIGQRVQLVGDGAPGASFEIIGVVGDVINSGLQAPIEAELWVPYTAAGDSERALIVRTAQDPAVMMNFIRKEVWRSDSGVALAFSSTLEDQVSKTLYAGPKFGFLLMTIFGCVGLILMTVGVYSVMAYSTARKTHEIGIRMALGAERGHVLGAVVRTGLRLVSIGLGIGIAISLMLDRVIGAQLNGVKAYDPTTLAAASLLLTLTAVVACLIPARRAARVDPLIALRYE